MKKGLTGWLLLGWAVAAQAQTNDHNWRSWEWIEDTPSARAAGMAGAFVAVADDSSAVVANPAGMALMDPSLELSGNILHRGSGTLPIGDTADARTGIGFIGGAGKIGRTFALGAYVDEPHDLRLTLTPKGASSQDTGFLQTTTTDAGVSFAWHPAPRVYVGLRVNVTHLRLQGEVTHLGGPTQDFVAGTAASQNRLAGDGGVLVKITEQATLGAVYVQGAHWDANRTATTLNGAGFPGFPFQLSSPSKFSGGLALRPSTKVLLSAQVDYVLLSQINDTLAIASGPFTKSDYTLGNTVDFRGGAELSIPLRVASLQVRGGLLSRGPSAFEFLGSDPIEAENWPSTTRRTAGTAGIGLVTRTLRLDVGCEVGGLRTVVVGGAAMRF